MSRTSLTDQTIPIDSKFTSVTHRFLLPLLISGVFSFLSLLFLLIPVAEWMAVLLYFVLIMLMVFALYEAIIKPIDASFPVSLYLLAFLAKMLGSAARYGTVVYVYYGFADASNYHANGIQIAEYFGAFDLSILGTFHYLGQGATNVSFLTGLLYTFMPPSLPGSFFFFAFLAFVGSVFFYRAFLVGFPEAEPGLYRLLIFFLPSILFWPSRFC